MTKFKTHQPNPITTPNIQLLNFTNSFTTIPSQAKAKKISRKHKGKEGKSTTLTYYIDFGADNGSVQYNDAA